MALPNLSGLSLHATAPTGGWNDQIPSGMVRRASSGDMGPDTQPSERVRQRWQDAADARARKAALERDTDEYRAWEAQRDAMLEQERKDQEEAHRAWMQDRAEKEALRKQAAFAELAAEEMAMEDRYSRLGRSFEYDNAIRTKAERARTDPQVAMLLRAEIEDAQRRFKDAGKIKPAAAARAELERAQKDLQILVIRANGIVKGVWP